MSNNNEIHPSKLNEQHRFTLTSSEPCYIFKITNGFNFIHLISIHSKSKKANLKDFILYWKRTKATSESTLQEKPLKTFESDFIEEDGWITLHTANIQFFKEGDNFATNGRRIEIEIKHLNPNQDFEVEFVATPLENYMYL